MDTRKTVIGLLLMVLLATVNVESSTCDDIDSAACQLMDAQRPDLCTDPLLAKTACPRYCNLCPLQCYHCNTSLTTTKNCDILLCGEGEVCMRKELTSYVDGHHETQLSCEPRQHCDGTDLTLTFGKRDVQSRDLSISCCVSDLCNNNQVTTTTTTTTAIPQTTTAASSCRKDITVLVDEAQHYLSGHSINLILEHLTDRLDIGNNDVLMSVVTFTNTTEVLWDLNRYTDKTTLQHAISRAHFSTGSGSRVDLDNAIKYLIKYRALLGNRANADDILIIVTSHDSHDSALISQLHAEYSQVFVPLVLNHGHIRLATDTSHVIRLGTNSNRDSVYANWAAMVCN